MQPDTRSLLKTGILVLLTGVFAALLMFTVFGGITHQGPHTNGGWISLIVIIGCVPTAIFALLLGFAKLIAERRRS